MFHLTLEFPGWSGLQFERRAFGGRCSRVELNYTREERATERRRRAEKLSHRKCRAAQPRRVSRASSRRCSVMQSRERSVLIKWHSRRNVCRYERSAEWGRRTFRNVSLVGIVGTEITQGTRLIRSAVRRAILRPPSSPHPRLADANNKSAPVCTRIAGTFAFKRKGRALCPRIRQTDLHQLYGVLSREMQQGSIPYD